MEDINKLVDILGNLNSPIQKEFVLARNILEGALVAEYESVVEQLSQILTNVKYSQVVRVQAGLQLKNVVFSNDCDQKQVKQNRWLSIMEDLRNQIKNNCISALEEGFQSAAECLAYIACTEIAVNQTTNVISLLVDNITGSTAAESLKQALQRLVPILLRILAHQDEVDLEDECNLHNAATVILVLMAQCSEESILELVLPYVKAHIDHMDWQLRDSALMAFGSILEGPSPTIHEGIVCHAMPKIIDLLTDQNPVVRDTAALTVGRVCEVLPEVPLNDKYCPLLLQTIRLALSPDTSVAPNLCTAIGKLAEGAFNVALAEHPQGEPLTYKLSNYFQNLANMLLETANRGDCGLQNAAYFALITLFEKAPKDCYSCIQKTNMVMLSRLNSLLEKPNEPQNSQERQEFVEYQSLLCITIRTVLSKINRVDALAIYDDTVKVLIAVLKRAQNILDQVWRWTNWVVFWGPPKGQPPWNLDGGDQNLSHYYDVQVDAMFAIAVIIDKVGRNFHKYFDEFKEVLSVCLQKSAPQVCSMAATVVCSLVPHSDGLNDEYFEDIFIDLRHIIWHAKTPEPEVIAALDALARFRSEFSLEFRPELLFVVIDCAKDDMRNGMYDLNNADDADYLNSLRSNCIGAFVSLIEGAKSYPWKTRLVLRHLMDDISFVADYVVYIGRQAVTTDELIGHCCVLIGHIAGVIGMLHVRWLYVIDRAAIDDVVNRACLSDNVKTKRRGDWAFKLMNQLREA